MTLVGDQESSSEDEGEKDFKDNDCHDEQGRFCSTGAGDSATGGSGEAKPGPLQGGKIYRKGSKWAADYVAGLKWSSKNHSAIVAEKFAYRQGEKLEQAYQRTTIGHAREVGRQVIHEFGKEALKDKAWSEFKTACRDLVKQYADKVKDAVDLPSDFLNGHLTERQFGKQLEEVRTALSRQAAHNADAFDAAHKTLVKALSKGLGWAGL